MSFFYQENGTKKILVTIMFTCVMTDHEDTQPAEAGLPISFSSTEI